MRTGFHITFSPENEGRVYCRNDNEIILQMVAASTYKVGCGATLCSSVDVFGHIVTDATLLVCSYGPAENILGK